MADDPIDAFDAFAEGIRRTEDELAAADALRSEKKPQRKPEDPPAADAEPPETK